MTQAAEGNFNPSFHFLGLIQKAMADGVARRCALPNSSEVYLVPAENTFYTKATRLEELKALCQAAPFDLTVESLPEWRRENANETVRVGRMWLRKQAATGAPAGLNARPLPELLWYATLSASRGQLMQGCRSDDPVRLKRWPDFSVLFHRDSYPTLAAYMAEESADLATVAANTGVPLAEVFSFYNACSVLGLIERGNVFEPREYLLGLIQRALADGQMRRCVLPGLPALFIAPQAGKYHTLADRAGLAAFSSAMLIDLEVDVVNGLCEPSEEEEVVQVGRMLVRRKKPSTTPKMPARSLSELMFLAALGASRGRMEVGGRPDEPVRLQRWPDAICMEQDRRFFSLAAFMTSNAASLTVIAERTDIPLARVVDFHNACAAAEIIEHPGRENLSARSTNDGERAVYRKIAKALDGLKAGIHVEHAY
ncbi:hypothetical protein [Methylomagnum sp.]